jgi:hypothetical protein
VGIDPSRGVVALPPDQNSDPKQVALDAAKDHFSAFAQIAAAGGAQKTPAANQQLINSYAPNVHFHDPLFGDINNRDDLMQMWELCGSGSTNNTIRPDPPAYVGKSANGNSLVTVHWEADYEIQGHPVHNVADTTLEIDAKGKIVDQDDKWSLPAWVGQALPGVHVSPELVSVGAKIALRAADAARDETTFFARLEKQLTASTRWIP